MICKVRSLKSRIKTGSFVEEIITSGNEEFKDFESDVAVGNRKLHYPIKDTPKSNIIIKQRVGLLILTLQLEAKNQIFETSDAYL
jgi:hypothetical protein